MKKSIILTTLAFSVAGVFAQEAGLTSKKGESILPVEKDWGIAIDATPFLNYAGNFFGKTAANSAPSWNFLTNNQTITGRYFLDAQTVIRGSLRIGFGSATTATMVANRMIVGPTNTANGYPNPVPQVENSLKRSSNTIGLFGGIEKRKGKTRLQGYYGGEVGFYISGSKDKYTYGNNLAANIVAGAPGSAQDVSVDPADDMGTGNIVSANSVIQGGTGSARITERKNGTTFSFGLRGFIGAEYFFMPKMSFGGEFGWGLGLTTNGASSTTYESVGNPSLIGLNNSSDVIGTTTLKGSKQGNFALDTDGKNSIWGPSATLRFNLYF